MRMLQREHPESILLGDFLRYHPVAVKLGGPIQDLSLAVFPDPNDGDVGDVLAIREQTREFVPT